MNNLKNSNTPLVQVEKLDLPKGGGAIQGIGEAFQAKESSGTFYFSIPIYATPCRQFEPILYLNYNTGLGQSIFGLGFNLSLPSILRQTNRGMPQYQNTDNFVTSNEDYLVPLTGQQEIRTLNDKIYTVQKYAPRKQQEFSLIEYWQLQDNPESQQSFWKITDKNHIVNIFGKTSQAQIANPENSNQVFDWLLEESYDSKGNHQLFFYKQENKENVSENIYENNRVITANRYISSIRYGNDKPCVDSMLLTQDPMINDPKAWHFEIVFNYGEYNINKENNNPYTPVKEWEERSDSFSTYNAGFEIRTYRICQSSLLFHRFTELGENPILIHTSSYNYQENKGGMNELKEIISSGYKWDTKAGAYITASYPNIELEYSPYTPSMGSFIELTTQEGKELLEVNEAPNYCLVDLFSEGVPGILYTDKTTVTYRTINKEFTKNYNSLALTMGDFYYENYSVPLTQFPIPRTVAGHGLTLKDITGDGKLDLVVTDTGMAGYYAAHPDQTWSSFHNFENYTNINDNADSNQIWIDTTGNGIADLVRIINNKVYVYPAEGKKGFGTVIIHDCPKTLPQSLQSSPTTVFNFADMAGTGRTHLVQITSGSVSYWPNQGYGRFSDEVKMGNAPIFPENFDTKRLFLADLDGSGTADIIYIGIKEISVYTNLNGNKFSNPINIPLPVEYDAFSSISFADVYGRGNECLIYTKLYDSASNGLTPKHYCYDFCQKNKPYLINHINNNLGSQTYIEYGSSVDFYLLDKKAGLPWITNLPFPVNVITKVIHIDDISKSRYTSQYAYHHGYYDGKEREFRGFGRVDRQDTEYFAPHMRTTDDDPNYVAPTLTKTWYQTGCFLLQQQLLNQYTKEYYQGDKLAFEVLQDMIECADKESIYQAYAAIAGEIIRTEQYALDEDYLSSNPYNIIENNCYVKLLQPKDQQLYAIFTTHNISSLTYTYERNPEDPQIYQNFTLKVDEYGNINDQCTVAYGRRNVEGVLPEQQLLKVVYYTSNYINQSEAANYLIGVPYENKAYSVEGLTSPQNQAFTADTIYNDIQNAINSPVIQAELIDWEKIQYVKIENDQTIILDLGKVTLPLLLGKQQKAEFTEEVITNLFKEVLSDTELQTKLNDGFYQFETMDKYWWNPGLYTNYNNINQYYYPKEIVDPAGNTTKYMYDPYTLLLISVEDALGNKTQALDIDYQTLQPSKMVNPNQQVTEISFDPLGKVVYTTIYGYEEGQKIGFANLSNAPNLEPKSLEDIVKNPAKYLGKMKTYFYYDLFAWKDRQEPTYTLELVAENYIIDNFSSKTADEAVIQIYINYTDGFNRELQTKHKVEAGAAYVYNTSEKKYELKPNVIDRWRSSGRKEYNNKGNIVKQYEPYFIDTPSYISNKMLDTFGVSSTTYYDPLGRIVQVLTPKGFLIKTKWNAWQQIIYDLNDTIIDSPYYIVNITTPNPNSSYYDKNLTEDGKENLLYCAEYFYNTPTTNISDNLGRVVVKQQINKYPADPADQNTDVISQILETHYSYDILGREITNSDPRLSQKGLVNFEMSYGMATSEPLRVLSSDAGTSWMLKNSLGNIIFTCNNRQIKKTFIYDQLNRLTTVMVKKDATTLDPLQLDQIVEQYVYGDSPGIEPNVGYNLKGNIYYQYDESGMLIIPSYSLGGKSLKTTLQFLQKYKQEVNWNDINPLDPNSAQPMLQKEQYNTENLYDALNRVTQGIDADQNQVNFYYYQSGLLSKGSVFLKDENRKINYINDIVYNAKSQPLTISYGNSSTTSYEYDSKTFVPTKVTTINKSDVTVQDISYEYDPMENIFQKTNNLAGDVYYNNQVISPKLTYIYDALYQVIQGTGREKLGNNKVKNARTQSYLFIPGVKDNQAIQNYKENYQYDISGNLIKTQHIADQNSWVRQMIVSDTSNRAIISAINDLDKDIVQASTQVDQYFDLCGNQIQTNKIYPLSWDHRNQLQEVTMTEHKDGNYDREYYVYDSVGRRKRKIFEQYTNDGQIINIKETIYLDTIEISRVLQSTNNTVEMKIVEEYHSLRLMGKDNCVATKYTWLIGKPPEGFNNSAILYSLQDKLNSYVTQLDENGDIISQEEYSPYGETTLFIGSGSADQLKHYRYSSKEKDITGFYYYGMRYYSPIFSRWLNPDPIGAIDGLNLYSFVNNNPTTYIDVLGNVRTESTAHSAKKRRGNNRQAIKAGKEANSSSSDSDSDESSSSRTFSDIELTGTILSKVDKFKAIVAPGQKRPELSKSAHKNLVRTKYAHAQGLQEHITLFRVQNKKSLAGKEIAEHTVPGPQWTPPSSAGFVMGGLSQGHRIFLASTTDESGLNLNGTTNDTRPSIYARETMIALEHGWKPRAPKVGEKYGSTARGPVTVLTPPSSPLRPSESDLASIFDVNTTWDDLLYDAPGLRNHLVPSRL